MSGSRKQRIVTWGLLETVVITALVLFLSWEFRSWAYVAIWSLLGWTQMLRTRRPTVLGLRLFVPVADRLTSWLLGMMDWFGALKNFGRYEQPVSVRIAEARAEAEGDTNDWKPAPRDWLLPQTYLMLAAGSAVMMVGALALLTWVVLLAIVLVAWATMIRFVATFWTCLWHPGASLRAIPRNWRRIAWGSEMRAPLEFVARHRLFLRVREKLGAAGISSEQMLTSFDLRNWRMELKSWRRTLTCLCLVAGLTLVGTVLHNPKSADEIEKQKLNTFFLWHQLGTIEQRLAEREAAERNGQSRKPNPDFEWDLGPTTKQLKDARDKVRQSIATSLRRESLDSFHLLIWNDWLKRVRWYANWPQRTSGSESPLAAPVRTASFLILIFLALLFASYYFGL